MNALDADSVSTSHRFPWKWNLADLPEPGDGAPTVFSCFSCGGGSSMGYKLAGYDVVGNCEIDSKVQEVYRANLHPRLSFTSDIRNFSRLDDYPRELLELDVLDGSPPCTTFSLLGDREKSWNHEKVFCEGATKQRLDDLFFPFIDLARTLKPKVVVAENVSALAKGNAKGYVREIIEDFDSAGYDLQIFSLNAARMGVPQTRERLFFFARRKDLGFDPLRIEVEEPAIPFGEVRTDGGRKVSSRLLNNLLTNAREGERSLRNSSVRTRNKDARFTSMIVWDWVVCPCITAQGGFYKGSNHLAFDDDDFRNVQTFPQDYVFCKENARYICGMSVPPVMMAHVANAIREQWLSVS